MISKIATPYSQSLEAALNLKSAESDKALFQQELARALSEQTSSAEASVSSPGTLQEIAAPASAADYINLQLEGSTDELLSMLESYSQQLESNDTTLKEMSAVIEGIQEKAADLLNAAELSADSDPELVSIAKESVITAQNEVIKFQRGDYL